MSLQKEHQRLRRAMSALLVALLPAAVVEACGDAGTPAPTPGDDAGAKVDASPDVQLAPDGDAAEAIDAAEERDCTTQVSAVDGGIDGDLACHYKVPCGLPSSLTVVGCELYTTADNLPTGCTIIQNKGCWRDKYIPGAFGEVEIFCIDCLGGSGRRPRGLARIAARGAPTALGAYFARMAHDEAAAVGAFVRMRHELARHGAPPRLVSAAARAARDEERHARAMARRARTLHSPIPSPRVRRQRPRALLAMAHENAVEGCIHETFGALVLGWQAARAPDASLRRMFARLAADETRHAALSWAVARWAEARLDAGGRARVARARARAISVLEQAPRAWAFDREVGRPDPAERAALLAGMIRALGLAPAARIAARLFSPRPCPVAVPPAMLLPHGSRPDEAPDRRNRDGRVEGGPER